MQVLRDHFGTWCTITDTHSIAHSGDIIKNIPRAKDTIRILIDRKNYTETFVAGAHLDVSVQDAIRNKADGVIVCYTNLPAKYGDGLCYGLDVASKVKVPFNHDNVIACTIKNVVSAVSKLMYNVTPRVPETDDVACRMAEFASQFTSKLNTYLKEVAPLLDMIDSKKLKEAAEDFQSYAVLIKRLAAAPPYDIEKKPILDAMSVIVENRKNQNILGCNLVDNYDYTSRKKNEVADDQAPTSKKRKFDATGVTNDDE